MGTVAVQALDNYIRAVGLEGNAIIVVVYVGVLDYDVI